MKKKSSWRGNLGVEILLGTAAAFYNHHSRHSRMGRRRRSRGENQTRTSSSLTSWAVGVFSLEWYPAPSLLDRQHPESFSKTGLVPLTSTVPGGGKKKEHAGRVTTSASLSSSSSSQELLRSGVVVLLLLLGETLQTHHQYKQQEDDTKPRN